MINTRLMHIVQNLGELQLAKAIEQVDVLLAQAVYMEKLNNKISLYGKVDSDEILVGREVGGREENLYTHDTVKLEDFSAYDVQEMSLHYQDFQDLIKQAKAQSTSLKREFFRIQIDLDDFSSAQAYFFNNREKYIGPACA